MSKTSIFVVSTSGSTIDLTIECSGVTGPTVEAVIEELKSDYNISDFDGYIIYELVPVGKIKSGVSFIPNKS